MPYLKKKIEKDFTTVHNTFLRDTNLGIGARGLLMTMMSMADGWKFSVKGLTKILPDGEKRISSALHSLKENGYLRLNRITAANGRVVEWEYLFADYPAFKEDNSDDDNENSKSNEPQPKSKEPKTKSKEPKKKALNTKSAKKTNNSTNSPHLQKADVEKADMDKADLENGGIYQISNNQISNNQISSNQSINQAAETNQPNLTDKKMIDGLIDKKRNQMTYSEILLTIGSIYGYDESEEENPDKIDENFFEEYNEESRDTKHCKIPYSLATNKNGIKQALEYLFCYSYYVKQMTNRVDESFDSFDLNKEVKFLDSVIQTMTELMTQATTSVSGKVVKYYEIIDIVNNIVKNSSLMEWYGYFEKLGLVGFKQHWEDILARKWQKKESISNYPVFFKSCIANYLLNYGIYGTSDDMAINGIFRKDESASHPNGFNSDKYDCCVNAFDDFINVFDDTEKTTVPEKSNTSVQSEPTIQEVQSESTDISAIQTDNQEIQEHSEQSTVNISEFLARLKGETDEQNEQKKKIEEQNKQTRLKNALFFKQMYDETGEPLPKHIAETIAELTEQGVKYE